MSQREIEIRDNFGYFVWLLDDGDVLRCATSEEYVWLSPLQAKQIAEFCMAFWIRHASTMKFDSMKESE